MIFKLNMILVQLYLSVVQVNERLCYMMASKLFVRNRQVTTGVIQFTYQGDFLLLFYAWQIPDLSNWLRISPLTMNIYNSTYESTN